MSERPDNLLGETLGSYRIERQLGSGGMGAVYLGVHPQIESRVAIKVLHPGYDTMAGIVERFIDEARAVNRIGHPGIVRIHDCATKEGIGVYLVMEYLEGETLADVIEREGQLAAARACPLLQQCAAALSASHTAGIVHRDLKPENLFLVEDAALDGGIRVKVLDFGIAKLIDDKGLKSGKTETGAVFGTPLFMAPEQCVSAKDVDHRADIYGLGAIAYRALSGRYPFEAGSVGQLVLMQQTESPPPLRGVNPQVPEALAEAIHRALQTKREDRFASMAEFGAALQPFGAASQITGPIRPASLAGDPAAVPRDPAAKARDPAVGARDPAAQARVPVPAAQPMPRDPAVVAKATVLEKPAGREAGGRAELARPNTTLSGATGQRVDAPPAKPRRTVYLVGLPVALALGAVVLLLVGRGGDQTDRAPTVSAVAARAPTATGAADAVVPAEAKVAVDAATATAAATAEDAGLDLAPQTKKVRVVLAGIPPGAEVLLDGERVEPQGKALELEADGRPHLVRVVASGYLPAERRFVADADQRLRFRLRRARVRRRGEPTKVAPSAPEPRPRDDKPATGEEEKPGSATPTFEDL